MNGLCCGALDVNSLDIQTGPEALSASLSDLLSDWGAGTREDICELIGPLVSELTPERLTELVERTRNTGREWEFYPADPFVRKLSRLIMRRVVTDSSEIDGTHQLRTLEDRRVLLVGNHLSYVDVNVLDYLCDAARYGAFADRFTAVVGPKVYTAPIRLLASLCFGAIKTPQSSSIASGEAVMSPREVARLARQTLERARERIEAGDHLVLFPEGSRSRSGALQSALPAAARYLEIPDLWIVPFAHTGCQKLVPLEEDHVYPNPVHIRIGAPIEAARLLERTPRNRSLAADVVGFWIAALLPEAYRGYYARPTSSSMEQASAIADELSREVST